MINEQSDEKRSSKWWIWPLLPFASIIGAALGAFLLVLIQWFGMKVQGGFREDGWYFLYIMPVLSSAIFGWLFSYITLYLAPKGKVIAATVMVTVLGVILSFSTFVLLVDPYREFSESIQASISSVVTMIAAISTIVSQKDDFQ
ncbi:hypothetical protein NMS63_003732 [Vibrio cholerae]|nr:hypothetical protein [Vibrio cholerae]EKF9882570.1 hypothetical protein [Vibrio cholerae]